MNCNRDGESSTERLRYLFCNDLNSTDTMPVSTSKGLKMDAKFSKIPISQDEYTDQVQQVQTCVRVIVERMKSNDFNDTASKVNETASHLLCSQETERAQANFTALTKKWTFLSNSQKNFCSQVPMEDGRLWRNYMACITAKLEKHKLYSRDRNSFVRTIVCQDEDAPEVNNFSKARQEIT